MIIDEVMTIVEAAMRWHVSPNTLKSACRGRKGIRQDSPGKNAASPAGSGSLPGRAWKDCTEKKRGNKWKGEYNNYTTSRNAGN